MRFSNGLWVVFITCGMACQPASHSDYASDPLPVLAERIVQKEAVRRLPKRAVMVDEDGPFTGKVVSHYADGVLAESVAYLSGKQQGLHQKWFEDGTLSFEAAYENGKRHGITRSWWRNGKLRSESHFEWGKSQGLQTQWYQSGAKFKELRLVAGREVGLQRAWRENGKIYNNYEAKDGRIFGLKRANLCYELDDETIQYREE